MSEFSDVERPILGPRVLARKSSLTSLLDKRKWISNRVLGHKLMVNSWERGVARGNVRAATIKKKLMTKKPRGEFDNRNNRKDLKKFQIAFRIILILFVVCICLLTVLIIYQAVQQNMLIDNEIH